MLRKLRFTSFAVALASLMSVLDGSAYGDLRLPLIAFVQSGGMGYDATSDLLSMEAMPIAVRLDARSRPRFVTPTGSPPVQTMEARFRVDESGRLVGGAPGHDLEIFGAIDADGDGDNDYDGVLLTGEIRIFEMRPGSPETGEAAEMDVRFAVTGGSLASLFGTSYYGINGRSDDVTFVADFSDDFTGQLLCTSGAVPAEGACCLLNGNCLDDLRPIECLITSGQYQGNDTDCADIVCTPQGSCCFRDGICLDRNTAAECVAAGGEYQGDGSHCDFLRCNRVGACCYPNGVCIDGCSNTTCIVTGGFFQGDATWCRDVDCEPIGACCKPQVDICIDGISEAVCDGLGGVFQGGGTGCADADCNP